MRIHRLPILIAALIACAAPAHADWGTTHWGMTVDEVLAAHPGSAAVPPGKENPNNRLLRLVWGSATLGDMALGEYFYFDPATGVLALVRLEPKDKRQCRAWRDTIVARYGRGTEKPIAVDRDHKLVVSGIDWTRPAAEDGIGFTSIVVNDSAFMMCQLLVRRPGST